MIHSMTLNTTKRLEMVDITNRIQQIISEEPLDQGMVMVFVPHTTAAVTINENTDPDVQHDILLGMDYIVPNRHEFKHVEGNADAHLKASLIGHNQWLMIEKGRLKLGRWQGVYFCEFDGPRTRKVEMMTIRNGL